MDQITIRSSGFYHLAGRGVGSDCWPNAFILHRVKCVRCHECHPAITVPYIKHNTLIPYHICTFRMQIYHVQCKGYSMGHVCVNNNTIATSLRHTHTHKHMCNGHIYIYIRHTVHGNNKHSTYTHHHESRRQRPPSANAFERENQYKGSSLSWAS